MSHRSLPSKPLEFLRRISAAWGGGGHATPPLATRGRVRGGGLTRGDAPPLPPAFYRRPYPALPWSDGRTDRPGRPARGTHGGPGPRIASASSFRAHPPVSFRDSSDHRRPVPLIPNPHVEPSRGIPSLLSFFVSRRKKLFRGRGGGLQEGGPGFGSTSAVQSQAPSRAG